MGCGSTTANEQSYEFSYCFRKDEVSLIKKLKKEIDQDIKDEIEEGGDNTKTLYRKIEIDFTKEEIIFKEYFVIYLPNDFGKQFIILDYIPMFNDLSLESQEADRYPKYAKKNNDPLAIERFECKKVEGDKNNEDSGDSIKSHIELKVTQKDLEKNLITIEACYNIKLKSYYGFYDLHFESKDIPCSYSFIIDNNIIVGKYKYDKEIFTEVSNTLLYSFNNKKDISVSFRDKRIKINIENELDKNLLSIFTSEEINQINSALNEMVIVLERKNLIYQKAIHNIKNNKDYIKIYNIIFSSSMVKPVPDIGVVYDCIQPIIINKFKINNKLVRKEDSDDDVNENKSERNDTEKKANDNNEGIDGYYYSNNNRLDFYYDYTGTFALYEFDIISNENVDYFQLNCNSLLDLSYFFSCGSYFRYEIILNGNRIEFSDNDFKYTIKDDKIIFEGYLDNYNEKKYIELERKETKNFKINKSSMGRRVNRWKNLREKELIPEIMKLI